MSDKGATSDRSDVIFLIAALSLVAGVPAALYTIYIFAESIELVATLVLFAILIVCIAGVLIVRYRDRIIDYIFKVPKDIAEAFAADASGTIDSYLGGRNEEAKEHLSGIVKAGVARYM